MLGGSKEAHVISTHLSKYWQKSFLTLGISATSPVAGILTLEVKARKVGGTLRVLEALSPPAGYQGIAFVAIPVIIFILSLPW